jgi:ribonuclease P protein component
MIDKTHRFQGLGSLRFVYKRGQTIRGQACSLKYVVNRRNDTYRVAVVVSRKVHKSAVIRNRIRRRIYELVRTEAPKIDQPFDLVFIAHSDQFADIPSDQLRSIILDQLASTGATSYRP